MPPNPNNPVKGEREVGETEEDAEECRGTEKKKSVSSLVDELLSDIYGKAELKRKQSLTTGGEWSWHESDQRNRGNPRFRSNLKQIEAKCWSKGIEALREEIAVLESLIAQESNNLVKYLKRKDYLLARREGHYDVITAVIHAISMKTRDDMKMKFSLAPGTETGFSQWVDAMKMVAQLPGGVPSEFRTKLWLQLSERHLSEHNIDWEKAEAIIFNEWTNPDDEELGVQIVKDLHRTGCSLFCGAQEQNQALLKRVLLAYARWNKNVGYCQGFNMLAALILQVMDRDEKNAVKVMIYLIEGVLPESYFANNLRGLSVDMAVFRDLLRLRLPKLSKHLEALQNDTNSGTSYEPPLTNVFTMQWFLTLFSNCLPQQTVLRVWDLVFLHGNEVLLRTALAIWGILQERIMSVDSADEFYSIMGVVTREMLEFGLMDANNLIKMIVMVDPFPNELQELREKYLYNISPWTQSVQSAARKGIKLFYSDPEDQDDTEDEDKIALATAYGVFRRRVSESGSREVQPMGPTLDISVLKQQYAKLRERQRQAHIIISAACSSSIPANLSSVPTVSVNHLLMGKSALVNKGRRIGPPEGSIPPPKNRAVKGADVRKQSLKKEVVISGETLDWKDAEKRRCSTTESKKDSNTDGRVANNKLKTKSAVSCNGLNREGKHFGEEEDVEDGRKRRGSTSSGSSTSTELCDDEFHRLSDFDSEEANPDKGREEIPKPYHPEREGAETQPTYEEARKCAAELLRDIEEAVETSERLIHLKNPDNNNVEGEGEPLSTSSHDNIIIKSPGIGDVEEEFLKTEPEVPIAGNVIDNTENRIFDRSKMEETTPRKEWESKIREERDRRKSDLALSVIKENLEMLSKFSQKSAMKEERNENGDEKINGYKEVEKSIGKEMRREEERQSNAGVNDENKDKVVVEGVMMKERPDGRVLEEIERTEGRVSLVNKSVFKMPEEEREEKEVVLGVKNKLQGGDRWKSEVMDVEREEDRSKRLMEVREMLQEEDRSRRYMTEVKQEDQPRRAIEGQEKIYLSRGEITEVKRDEDRAKRALENQEKLYEGVRPKRELTEVKQDEERVKRVMKVQELHETDRSKRSMTDVKQEEDQPKRTVHDREKVHEEDQSKSVKTQLEKEDRPRRVMVVEEKVYEVERSSSQKTGLKQEDQLKRVMDIQEKVYETDRSRRERSEVKQEDRPKTAIEVQDEDGRSRSEVIKLKQEEDRVSRVMEAQPKVQEDRSSSQIGELKREEGRPQTVVQETGSRRSVPEMKQEEDRPRRVMEEENRSKRVMEVQEKMYEGGRLGRDVIEMKQEEDRPMEVEEKVPEKDRSRAVLTELKQEEDRVMEVQEKVCEGGRSRKELTELKRVKEGVINGKTGSFGDHFRKGEEQGDMTHQKTLSRVNKEVNTDITIAADIAATPSSAQKRDEGGNLDDFLITLISTKSSYKSPERFKPEKPRYRESKESSNVRPFGREDFAERWRQESERIESKIEMSKSDWDLKMRRIAELETTTREKLNELKSKSIVHRHRSLDRFEGRDRKSPIPRIHIPLDESEDLESRKKKISALSFDEITSRTEKLLGANLSLEASGYRKFRKSGDENGDSGKTYEYYSSPTSPEYRPRRRAEYSSPKRYEARWKHSQPAEEDWLTITEENGRGTTLELVSPGRKSEKDTSPVGGFNPFPTRTLSRPKELGVRLGMYPPSPEGAHSSKKSH